VQLNFPNAEVVREAAADTMAEACATRSDTRIEGVTVQPMILRPKEREQIAGLADDPAFGTMVVFVGAGVEVIDDKALAATP
jgi:acetyltransferase